MHNFYCNVCGETVKLVNGKCPKCKTDWNKIIKECVDTDKEEPINLYDDTTEEKSHSTFLTSDIELSTEENADIDDVCEFLLKYGVIGKVLLIIASIIIIVMSFISLEESDGGSLIYTVIGLLCLFVAFLFEATIKWRVYLLLTNKKINNGIYKLINKKDKKN